MKNYEKCFVLMLKANHFYCSHAARWRLTIAFVDRHDSSDAFSHSCVLVRDRFERARARSVRALLFIVHSRWPASIGTRRIDRMLSSNTNRASTYTRGGGVGGGGRLAGGAGTGTPGTTPGG